MPEKDQVAALTILTKNNHWDPLTLRENGFFHISMMAILGVAAWTRGKEKEEIIKKIPIHYEKHRNRYLLKYKTEKSGYKIYSD